MDGAPHNSPYPLSSKMRELPIIHVNVDLPVFSFAHMIFMQNTCKTRTKYKYAQAIAHWTLTTLRSVGFSDFTQLQRSGCKEKRMQRGRPNLTFDRQFSDIIDEIDQTGYCG